MNYHVFIVDQTTFQYHLAYLFAGTGAGDKQVPFLSDPYDLRIHSATERNLVGMIADISRIRTGDKIIFYLQASANKPGMFFGVFQAASAPFFDENTDDNYLRAQLGKALTFRVKIKPDTVYPVGISEHAYLDSLDGISAPFQMCWSMIYRKLKGNRGCTMITEHEYSQLVRKLSQANDEPYPAGVKSFTFDQVSCRILSADTHFSYAGRESSIAIKERLLFKANRHNAFEGHLQAYILQNYDSGPLRNLLLPYPEEDCWIGNEVSCGVGMQRIDILIRQDHHNDVYIKLIELKCVQPEAYILNQQLPWYIHWLSEYIVPNYTERGKAVHLIPCVIALDGNNDTFIDECDTFSKNISSLHSNFILEPLEFLSFSVDQQNISFKKVK